MPCLGRDRYISVTLRLYFQRHLQFDRAVLEKVSVRAYARASINQSIASLNYNRMTAFHQTLINMPGP